MVGDGKMGVQFDVSRGGGVSRLEVIEGPSGRRRRTEAERARIAAESLMPGASVAEVARLHGTTRWQVYSWRRMLRTGVLTVPENLALSPLFAELVVEAPEASTLSADAAGVLEIAIGDVVIRAGTGIGEERLTCAIRAARAAVGR